MKFLTHKLGYHAIIGGILGITGIFGVFSAASVGINLFFDGLAGNLITTTFPVSFIGGGNSFAGSLIFNNPTTVNQTITFTGGISVTCEKQMHGYYFNAARGVGLLPLSTQTQMNDGVLVQGGLYSSCSGNGARVIDLIGALTYSKNGTPLGDVVFGVATDVSTNTSNGIYQVGALSWMNNRLNGRFFDTMFGIGNMSSSNFGLGTIGSVSNMIGIFSNIYIQGHVGIGQSVDTIERQTLAVNLAGTKTLLTSNDEVLSSNIINTVSRNTEKRCRGTTVYVENDITNGDIGRSKFVCIDLNNQKFTINNTNISLFYNKDIVFLNGNVELDNSIYGLTSFPSRYLSIYIPDGNLIFDSNIETTNLTDLDNNGFPSTTASTKGVYLVGNFVVNGLVVGSEYINSYMSIPYRTFIHGKLVSLNTFTTVSDKRNNLLATLLGNRTPTYDQIATENPYFPNTQWNAGMGDLFAWRCAATTTTGSQAQTGGMGAYPLMPINGFDLSTIDAVRSIPCPVGNNHSLSIIEKSLNSSFFLK